MLTKFSLTTQLTQHACFRNCHLLCGQKKLSDSPLNLDHVVGLQSFHFVPAWMLLPSLSSFLTLGFNICVMAKGGICSHMRHDSL